MGCGMSTEDKEGKARNEEIENQLKRDKMMQRNEIKMLLLGMSSWILDRYATCYLITGINRSGRIWKIHHLETNETHPRGRLLS